MTTIDSCLSLPERGSVHLHAVDLVKSRGCAALQGCGSVSAAEVMRAGRFHFERDRDAFVARRIWLRVVLARYLAVNPAQVRLTAQERGKPVLEAVGDWPDVRFSLSHSRAFAVLAVACDAEVGVDIEGVMPTDPDGVAREVMTPGEIAALRKIADVSAKQHAFLNLWTRKEALLKALGSGLLVDPKTVEVGLHKETLFVARPGADSEPWSLAGFVPGSGLVGAVAVPGERLTVVACGALAGSASLY